MTENSPAPTPSSSLLPTAVADYFDYLDGTDKPAAIVTFAPNAVVTDDGHRYAGRDEILGWLGTAASEYTVTSTRLGVQRTVGGVVVTVHLEGDFPGGVVDLRNRFAVDVATGLILSLTIAP